MDQNSNALNSQVTLTAAPPQYCNDGWFYRGDRGDINLYEVDWDTRFIVWDTPNPKCLVACGVQQSYSDTQTSYKGAGLSGSEDEISGLFARPSPVIGGGCRVSRR